MKRLVWLLSAALLIVACNCKEKSEYSDSAMWCCAPAECNESVDVFYLVSTNIIKSVRENGSESSLAILSDKEKTALSAEINYVHKEFFPDSLNFFAPYYHQITLKSLINMTSEEYISLIGRVEKEICDAFDYYMANLNNGRPFVLAGFSQGAMLVETLLKHMSDEQYSRMVAAYMFGFGLDSAAVASPHIKPASSAYDKGVTISFNSSRDTSSIWKSVYNNACACINPVNWSVDATPASFEYDGDMLTAALDTVKNIVIVDGYSPAKYEKADWDGAPWPKGNYHHFELMFYNSFIRQNVLDRCH